MRFYIPYMEPWIVMAGTWQARRCGLILCTTPAGFSTMVPSFKPFLLLYNTDW